MAVTLRPGFIKPWNWRRFSREKRWTENNKNKRQSPEALQRLGKEETSKENEKKPVRCKAKLGR